MNQRITKARLNVLFEDDNGNVYDMILPNVELTLEAEINYGDRFGDEFISYKAPDIVTSMKIDGRAFRSLDEDTIMTIRLLRKGRKRDKRNR